MGSNCAWMVATAFICAVPLAQAAPRVLTVFVSTAGNDSWTGKLPSPHRTHSDGPFRTIQHAVDVIRATRARRAGVLRAAIELRGGSYSLARSVQLDGRDGGAAVGSLVVRSFQHEQVSIVGGRPVSGWKPVTDGDILKRLDPSARDHVLQCSLPEQQITDFGRLRARGFGRPEEPAPLELFYRDQPMTLARWPNGDNWATIKGTPQGPQGGMFSYDGERPARWVTADDAWLHGYWTYDWADTYEKIASIDPVHHTISTAPPHGAYGYSPGRRFYALNLLEELDTPGEYYLDRRSGVLYFWPPGPLSDGSTVVSLSEEPLLAMHGASEVDVQGLTFEDTRAAAIQMTGCTRCRIAGCTVRNTGTTGIAISGGADCEVQTCDIYETGDAGVLMDGGDRQSLTPGGHAVINCYIHHPGRWDRTYRPAIGMNGVGNRAAHNLIEDAPHNAILMSGNDHIVEFNEISRVCTETGDAGAVYMGRDLTERGTVIRFNHFHDIGPTIKPDQPGRYTEVMAVYLDDCFCGVTIYGNLFERAGRSIMLGGGRDNTIENNIFVDCHPDIHVDQRGKSWAAKYFEPGSEWQILEHARTVPFDRPPYTKYPHLQNILKDDPAAAKYNRILRNIHFGGDARWIDWLDGMSEKTVETLGNWTNGDPGFVDARGRDYRLKPQAPVLKNGFAPLPLERMGLMKDSFRKTLPTRSTPD